MRNIRRINDGGVSDMLLSGAKASEKLQLSTELKTLKAPLNAKYAGTLVAVKANPNITQDITDYNRKMTEIHESFKNVVLGKKDKYKLPGFNYGDYIEELKNASLIKTGVSTPQADGKRRRSRSKRRRSRSKRRSDGRKRKHSKSSKHKRRSHRK